MKEKCCTRGKNYYNLYLKKLFCCNFLKSRKRRWKIRKRIRKETNNSINVSVYHIFLSLSRHFFHISKAQAPPVQTKRIKTNAKMVNQKFKIKICYKTYAHRNKWSKENAMYWKVLFQQFNIMCWPFNWIGHWKILFRNIHTFCILLGLTSSSNYLRMRKMVLLCSFVFPFPCER